MIIEREKNYNFTFDGKELTIRIDKNEIFIDGCEKVGYCGGTGYRHYGSPNGVKKPHYFSIDTPVLLEKTEMGVKLKAPSARKNSEISSEIEISLTSNLSVKETFSIVGTVEEEWYGNVFFSFPYPFDTCVIKPEILPSKKDIEEGNKIRLEGVSRKGNYGGRYP